MPQVTLQLNTQWVQLPVSRFDPACLCKLCMSSVAIFFIENIRKYFCFYLSSFF